MPKISDEVKWCNNIKKKHFKNYMILTKENIKDFKTADECHICNRNIQKKTLKIIALSLGNTEVKLTKIVTISD